MDEQRLKLHYAHLNSLVKFFEGSDARIKQLRIFSFGIITAILSFTPISLFQVIPIFILVTGAVVGLLLFDIYYRKIARQVDAHIKKIAHEIEKNQNQLEPFSKIDKLCPKFEFEQCWYLFILCIAYGIIFLKGISSLIAAHH